MVVRTRVVEKPSEAGGDARIEDALTTKGFKWTFHAGLTPDQFDLTKSLRNQARVGTPLNDTRVDTYAESMKKGDKFPPVVAHGKMGKLEMADGNHRLSAAIKANKPLDAYVITGPAQTITLYTYEANTKHGLPTTESERIQHALYLHDSGVPLREAAAQLSVPLNLVTKASQKKNTDRRFEECKIPLAVIDKLPESTKWRLAQISTDEGFTAAVELASKAALGVDEVFQLVTEMNELKSSTRQVKYVGDQYHVYDDRISTSGGGVFKGRGITPKGRVAGAMTTVLNLPDNLERTAKMWAGPEREETAKRMRATARRLNELARVLSSR